MEIRINNEKVDYHLEQEVILGEVIDGLSEWLHSAGFTITEVERNSLTLPLAESSSWRDETLDTIERIDVTAMHPLDLLLNKLNTLIDYLEMLQSSADNPAVFTDLLKGVDDVAAMLDETLDTGQRMESDHSEGRRFLSIAAEANQEEGAKNLLLYVRNLQTALQSRLRELVDPAGELERNILQVEGSVEDLSEISVLLQTGKDVEAMSRVVRFTDLYQKLIRLCIVLAETGKKDIQKIVIDGIDFAEFTKKMNALMRELADAMESGDTVLVGDLLEYEIAEKMVQLTGTLQEV